MSYMSRFIVFQSFNKFATPATAAAILAPGKLPATPAIPAPTASPAIPPPAVSVLQRRMQL